VDGAIEVPQDRHEGYGSNTLNIVYLILSATITGLYLSAATLLFFRRRVGRYIIIAMSGFTLVAGAGGLIYSVVVYGIDHQDVIPLSIAVTIIFLLELLMLCMALMSSTQRWIAARTADTSTPGRYQPTAPMYGGQQSPPY
jgi:hypothetical protein